MDFKALYIIASKDKLTSFISVLLCCTKLSYSVIGYIGNVIRQKNDRSVISSDIRYIILNNILEFINYLNDQL